MSLFERTFQAVIATGHLRMTDARGRSFVVGDGTGPPCAIRVTDTRAQLHIELDPWLAIGECYMDGRLIIEEGDLYLFLEILLSNVQVLPPPRWTLLLQIFRFLRRRIDQFNPAARARRNAAAHYDIDTAIYRLFLDRDMQYSCAYFETPGIGLDEAQRLKKRHIAAKLHIRPGHRVLDIGCGWGGMAFYLAGAAGAEVTGITLSRAQLDLARQREQEFTGPGSTRFRLEDYRETAGTYDRIVSVGMFEHVGIDHYPAFFRCIRDLLADDGVALIHSIGRFDGPAPTNAFIRKYIFPGGALPALSEVMPLVESSGLKLCDVEIWRLHYAETLKKWRQRFMARRDEAARLRDERFCRMWEFYLAASEASFRYQDLMVFQLLLTRHQGALPLTRDYIAAEKSRLLQRELPV